MKIKLCGIRREEDVSYLNEFPPDYAGFVFAETRRKVTPEQAERLAAMLRHEIKRVGVFVNYPLEKMKKLADILDVFQLHGDEDDTYIIKLRKIIPEKCEIWRAVRLRSDDDITAAERLHADKLLFDAYSPDAYGGTGKSAKTELLIGREIAKPYFIAGGITPENIGELYRLTGDKAFGYDISGGIETDGVKDRIKVAEIKRFTERI